MELGVALAMVGTGFPRYVYAPAAVTVVASEFLITMSAAPVAWEGAVTEMFVEPVRLMEVTGAPPIVTATPDLKFVPTIVSGVPPPANPDDGATEVKVGDDDTGGGVPLGPLEEPPPQPERIEISKQAVRTELVSIVLISADYSPWCL